MLWTRVGIRAVHRFAAPVTDRGVLLKTIETVAAAEPLLEREALGALHNLKVLSEKAEREGTLDEALVEAQEELTRGVTAVLLSCASPALLHTYFRDIVPPFAHVTAAVQALYRKDPKAYVPRNTAYIPFRHELVHNRLINCFQLIDLTNNHRRYRRHLQQQALRTGTKIVGATGVGMLGLLQLLHASFPWLDASWFSNFWTMASVYLLNAGFMALLAFGQIGTKAKDQFMVWQTGTFQTHWYLHQEEMKMCSEVAEFDLEVNGVDGFATKGVVDECVRRKMEPADNRTDQMMHEYWIRNGDGFEWVEPDQDPADLELITVLRRTVPEKVKAWEWATPLLEAKS